MTNCDEESAAAANCDDGGASIYLAPVRSPSEAVLEISD